MHIQSIYRLLLAAADQPKVIDPSAEIVVREMVDLGLVDATLSDGRTNKFSAINRVTDAGKRFVRVLEAQQGAVLRVYRSSKQEAARVLEEARFAGAGSSISGCDAASR